MSNKEKSIRRALNAIQKHIASFDYDSVDRYTKLVGFLLMIVICRMILRKN